MASRRPNNVKRTEWNRKCREKLSAHIYRRLGIEIETSQVRLKPNVDDLYTWDRLDEKQHLFSENPSDLSIGQLKDVCDGVDASFTAIWKAPIQSELSVQDGEESCLGFPRLKVSFVAKIDDLHQDNVRLSHEISKWERRVTTESEGRREAELEASELKVTIQQLQMDNEKLEKHKVSYSLNKTYLQEPNILWESI
ncbi:MAG: hypothetical protein M1825_006416 [Sarcosagium campestre]|nr:MAG: hypothetical protein M1825_006416 [Sarcosagium campestre]